MGDYHFMGDCHSMEDYHFMGESLLPNSFQQKNFVTCSAS